MSHLKLCSLCILPSLCPLAKSLTLKYVLQALLQPRKENLLVGMNFMGALSAKKTTFLKPPSSQYCMKILHNHKNYSKQISHQKPASDFNYIDLSQYIPTQVMGCTYTPVLAAGRCGGRNGWSRVLPECPTTEQGLQFENVLQREPGGAVPFGFAASTALLCEGNTTRSARGGVSALTTNTTHSVCCPSTVKA